MDDLSFRLGNTALGNDEGVPGLESAMVGPSLRFTEDTEVCVTGAPVTVRVDGTIVPQWRPVTVPAGGLLDVGALTGPGLRVYVLVAGGLDVSEFLAVQPPSPSEPSVVTRGARSAKAMSSLSATTTPTEVLQCPPNISPPCARTGRSR